MELESLKLPELPKLNAGYVAIQESVLTQLINYINAQTSTINSLSELVRSLEALDTQRYNAHIKNYERLNLTVQQLALALGGVYANE